MHNHTHQDLNLRAAFLHILADTLSSIGVIMASLVVWGLGWNWADTLIGFGIAVLIASRALPLIKDSLEQLNNPSQIHLNKDYHGLDGWELQQFSRKIQQKD